MKTIFESTLILSSWLFGAGFLFSPLIISLITKNWWFMFLFLVSWIPMAIVIAKVIVKVDPGGVICLLRKNSI